MERRVIPSQMDTVFEYDYAVRPRTGGVSTRKPSGTSGTPPATSPGRPEPDDGAPSPTSRGHLRSPIGAAFGEGARRAEQAHHGLAAVRPGLRRAGRPPGVQPARQHGHRRRPEVLPGDPGPGRGAAQRGPRALHRAPAGRAALPDAGQRAGALRLHPDGLPLVHQDDRAPAGRRNVRRLDVQDDGRVRPRPSPARDLRSHPQTNRGWPDARCPA